MPDAAKDSTETARQLEFPREFPAEVPKLLSVLLKHMQS